MGTEMLQRRFAAIGARVKVIGPDRGAPSIDVGVDARGEFFDVRFAGNGDRVDLEVLDVQRRDRHLLLLARDTAEKSKFLCGHDERHWFVAAVPETARGVTGVLSAKVALQPPLVREAIERSRPKDAHRRRNAAYMRQGEWFFVPAPRLVPPAGMILRHEPLTRGRGKLHMMEFAYRRGSELVYVTRAYPLPLTGAEFARLSRTERRRHSWARMMRNPELFAMGAIRHPDHATVVLHGWHRVAMNTEQSARAMQHIAFLD